MPVNNHSPELNREQLVKDVARWGGQEIRRQDYPTWRTVFTLLLSHNQNSPLIVILDEFQFLADGPRGWRR